MLLKLAASMKDAGQVVMRLLSGAGRFILAGICASALAGCGSTSAVTTAPSPTKCGLSLSMSPPSIGADGGTASVTVSTQAECAWTASTTATWITGLTPASGQGGGRVDFQVAANPAAQARQAAIQLNDGTVQIRQDAAACHFDLTPRSQALPAGGGNVSIAIAALPGCAWTATPSDASWLSIAAPASGNGTGSVVVTVRPNTGALRTGSIAIADQSFVVTQAENLPVPPAPVCSSTITPTSATAPAGGNVINVTVQATAGCAWTAVSRDPWLTVATGSSGAGNGPVTINVAANTSVARIGALTIAGQTLTITQADGTPAPTPPPAPTPCSYALTASAQTATAASGTVGTSVLAPAGCPWTATTGESWLTVASGAAGSGNGSVSISVAANSGANRSGTVTIAGLAFTVNQAGTCTVSINPTSQSVAASTSTGNTVAVTTAAGCSWAATTTDTWLTITSGANGTGSGSVVFRATANSGTARTGTLTIGGLPHTVNQAGSCALTVNPTSQSLAASASTGNTIAITTDASCSWTATTTDTWLTITSTPNGSGNGSVVFSAAANTGAARTGTVAIGGVSFSVNQAGTCALSLNPTSQSLAASASTGNTVSVTTATGCGWTATTTDTWITITSAPTSAGSGSVVFSAAANTGAARTGTVTIGSVPFSVNQAGSCALTLSPTSQSLVATASTGNTIAVTTANGCNWNATTTDGWLTITSGAGNGNGSVVFSTTLNTGATRIGRLSIGGQTFTATQAGTCLKSLSSLNQSVAAAATTGNTVTVTTATGCTWTATSNASWLTITGGATGGDGNGTVTYNVGANTGIARSGTLTIANITFTVNQANGCSPAINPTSASAVAGATTGNTVSITAGTGCGWTSTSNAQWLTITGGASGSENGTTTYSVGANIGAARSGTLTVAGIAFTVNQASGCTYAINPTSATFPKAQQQNRTFAVMTTTDCGWTATTSDSWITITAASGPGNGTVRYDLSANNTGDPRVGTIVVGGRTFSITQNK